MEKLPKSQTLEFVLDRTITLGFFAADLHAFHVLLLTNLDGYKKVHCKNVYL